MTDPQHTREDFEDYALGVLRDDLREAIDRRLSAADPEALAALADASSFIATLAYAAPEADPPPAARQRLLDTIAPEARKPAKKPAPVTEFTQPRQPEKETQRNWRPALAWALAAGFLLFAVLMNQRAGALEDRIAELQQSNSQLSSAKEALEQQARLFERAMTIVSAPETRPVALDAPGSPRIRAYWREGQGLLIAGSNVPAVNESRTYQLWILPKTGAPIGAGTFTPGAQSEVLAIFEPLELLADVNALAITDEPEGGSPQPTTTPIWVGPLG